jgi:hypothetical protein
VNLAASNAPESVEFHPRPIFDKSPERSEGPAATKCAANAYGLIKRLHSLVHADFGHELDEAGIRAEPVGHGVGA